MGSEVVNTSARVDTLIQMVVKSLFDLSDYRFCWVWKAQGENLSICGGRVVPNYPYYLLV